MMFINRLTRLLAVAGLLMSGTACTFLPAAGPTSAQISLAASTGNEAGFTIVDVTPAVLAELGKVKPPSFIGRFPVGGSSAPRVIGIGDALAISIWEAGDGGLFSPGSAGSVVVGGSRQTQLPPTLVDRTGEITVPYAGRIRVVGRTPREVEQVIIEKLADRAIQPQAVVNIETNTANTVNVLGDAGGGKISLTQRDDRLLDVIAMAGGAKSPAYDTLVRVTRGSVTGTVSLQRVINDPRENISIKPGDTIVLLRSPQTFTSFGASNNVAQVPFEAENISLAEAIARVGGPNDLRADAAAVFLFRFEDPQIAQAVSPGVAASGIGRVPLVYRIDLRSAEGYFYAQTFPVRDKDTIYVANAASYDLSKFFNFLRSGTGVVGDLNRTTTTLGQ
ncbi:MAG TPA: polysaccharide biosynthesis/export family protein [Dehalococcoidia bacterium]|nr:polysaccharide biosynthesis/export family protein [Dehalococcoidia bacterium]